MRFASWEMAGGRKRISFSLRSKSVKSRNEKTSCERGRKEGACAWRKEEEREELIREENSLIPKTLIRAVSTVHTASSCGEGRGNEVKSSLGPQRVYDQLTITVM